jgi:hypothetical protein
MKKMYIQVSNDWVPKFVGTPEDVIEHLKDNYLDETMLEDWFNNEEVLTIKVIKMTDEEYEELGEWEP